MTMQEVTRFCARVFPHPVKLSTENGIRIIKHGETGAILACAASWKAALRIAVKPVLADKLIAEAAEEKRRAEQERKLEEEFVAAKQGGIVGKLKTKLFGVK